LESVFGEFFGQKTCKMASFLARKNLRECKSKDKNSCEFPGGCKLHINTGSERNPRLLEISLEIPLGVLADQQTRADWLDL